jgi:site-specific DNA recombinase
MTKSGQRIIGYVRVSSVSGRSGESFQSPEQQAATIRQWAKMAGADLLEVVVELDKPAGKGKHRPLFDAALERCQQREADGIAVAYVSRFGRSVSEALARVELLHEANARVVSIAEGIDSATPTGKLVLGLMLTLAEWERDRIRAQWGESQGGAIARGVHIGPTPFGYLRTGPPNKRNGNPTGPLFVDPETAPLVRKAFEMRAAGSGLRTIARHLAEQGYPMAERGVPKMLKNRTYLGEAFAPMTSSRTTGAHEPIIEPDLFDKCQWSDGPVERRRGSMVESVALVGARCAGCGRVMSIARGGSGLPVWRCQWVECKSRGSIAAHRLDEYVQADLDEAVREGATVTDLLIDDAHFVGLASDVHAARASRDELLSSVAMGELSAADAAALLKAASERVAAAEARRNAIRPDSRLTSGYKSAGDGLTLAQQRAQFARLIGRVMVAKATSRSQPVAERVTVELAA